MLWGKNKLAFLRRYSIKPTSSSTIASTWDLNSLHTQVDIMDVTLTTADFKKSGCSERVQWPLPQQQSTSICPGDWDL